MAGSENRDADDGRGALPLGDVTVVDATASLGGAYVGRLLGDVGASVFRVEGAETLRRRSLTLEASLWENGLRPSST